MLGIIKIFNFSVGILCTLCYVKEREEGRPGTAVSVFAVINFFGLHLFKLKGRCKNENFRTRKE